MEFDITTEPTPGDAAAISAGLVAHNRSVIGPKADPDSGTSLFVIAREDDSVIGGLRADCSWDMLHVEVIWVDPSHRGGGLGSMLLHRAERFAIDLGIGQALLETADFQARPFYESQGFVAVAEIADYPRGHTMAIMTKRLIDAG